MIVAFPNSLLAQSYVVVYSPLPSFVPCCWWPICGYSWTFTLVSRSRTSSRSGKHFSRIFDIIHLLFWLHILQLVLVWRWPSLDHMKALLILALLQFYMTPPTHLSIWDKHLRDSLSAANFPILHNLWEGFPRAIALLAVGIGCPSARHSVATVGERIPHLIAFAVVFTFWSFCGKGSYGLFCSIGC